MPSHCVGFILGDFRIDCKNDLEEQAVLRNRDQGDGRDTVVDHPDTSETVIGLVADQVHKLSLLVVHR